MSLVYCIRPGTPTGISCHSEHGMLCCRVLHNMRRCGKGIAGPQVEDNTSTYFSLSASIRARCYTLCLHDFDHRLHAVKCPQHVNLPETVDFGQIGVLDWQRLLDPDSSTVHTVVNTSEHGNGSGDHICDTGWVTNVDNDCKRLIVRICRD